jgi:hypothetical protein
MTEVSFGYRDWSKVPFKHRIANQFMTWFFNLLFRTDFKDLTNGFNAYSKKAVKTFIKDFKHDKSGMRYDIEAWLKWSVVKNKLSYTQVPVSVKYFKQSGNIRGIRMVASIIRFIITKKLGRLK